MAAVRILTGLHGGEPAAEVPRTKWRELVQVRSGICHRGFREDCRALVFFIEDAGANDWLGYGTREAYIRDGLELDPEMVTWAVDGLRRLDGKNAIGFDEAVVLGRHGGKRVKDQGDIRTLTERGTTQSYTIARLRRDRPDLAELVVQGELSANAAAIEAGFRRRTITVPLDPERIVAAWCCCLALTLFQSSSGTIRRRSSWCSIHSDRGLSTGRRRCESAAERTHRRRFQTCTPPTMPCRSPAACSSWPMTWTSTGA